LNHCATLDEFKDHPALQNDLDRGLLIPFVFHMDGIEVYTNTEFYAFSFGSLMAVGNILDKKMVMAMIPAYCMKDEQATC
jgi:hypothetical protein